MFALINLCKKSDIIINKYIKDQKDNWNTCCYVRLQQLYFILKKIYDNIIIKFYIKKYFKINNNRFLLTS